MASPETMLIPFCWGFIGILLLLIIVPFARGKSDLITSWNLFLLGSINYVGIAGLNAGYRPDYFRVLEYDRSDYVYFICGVIAFFVPLLLAYWLVKFPRKLAGRSLRKWPPASTGVLYFMLLMSLGFAFLGQYAPSIQGIAQIFSQLGNKAIVLALALAFAAWYGSRKNPVLIGTLAGVVVLTLLLAIVGGGGRRTMLGVLVTIPVCWYWFTLRYKSLLFNTVAIGVLTSVAFFFLVGYSQLRHFDRRGEMKERNFSSAAEVLTKLPGTTLDSKTLDTMLGQNAGQTSLAAIHLYTGEHDPEPFHSVLYVGSIWIPRAFWPDKPVGLGYSLPKTARAKGTRATWGPGIVGHGFHEGGLHMLVFYGTFVGLCLRYFDELLVRQSRNAYLLATFAAMAPHIFGWTRGDIGTFTIQIIGSLIALVIVNIVGRVLFGAGMVYPRTNGPEYVNTNLFALRRQQPVMPAPTDFRFADHHDLRSTSTTTEP